MSEHTPGRMAEPCNYAASKFELQAGGRQVAVVNTLADASRLVACWNACDGIDTEYLEGDDSLPHYARRLMAQRDELLAALKRAERKLTAYVGVCTGDKELTGAVLPMSRAAIAKVKGGAA